MKTNIFANEKAFNNAEISKTANYLRPGHYLARIDVIKDGETQDTIPYIVLEMTIVKVYDDHARLGHKVGEEIDYMIQKIPVKKGGLCFWYRDVKLCFGALMNVKGDDITVEDCIPFFEDSQPLTGFVIEIKAKERRDNKAVDEEGEKKKSKGLYVAAHPLKRRISVEEMLVEIDEEVLEKYFTDELIEALQEVEIALNGEEE